MYILIKLKIAFWACPANVFCASEKEPPAVIKFPLKRKACHV